MKRRLINGLEQDMIQARQYFARTRSKRRLLRWVKRSVNKRERREGKKEAEWDGDMSNLLESAVSEWAEGLQGPTQDA